MAAARNKYRSHVEIAAASERRLEARVAASGARVLVRLLRRSGMRRDPIPAFRPLHLCDATMLYAAHSGGVRRYIEAKHAWLARHAYARHTVVAPGEPGQRMAPYHHALPAWRLPFWGGFRFPWRPRPWSTLMETLMPDLIEAGDPYGLGWAALDAGQHLGVPVAGFYHSNMPSLARARFGAPGARVAQRYVARFYARLDLVMAPSCAVQRELEELGVPHVRVRALGVDTETFHPRRRSGHLRRWLGLPPGTRLLVFAGRNAREKRLDSLLQAVARLGRGYHLLLAGPGMERPQQDNATAISRYVDARELAVLLAGSDALVHAGDAETFGLIVLEAMASGIPVVGVDAGAVPELVTPSVGVLARSSAPGDLADAIAALFECDVSEMGRAARRAVETRWTWDICMRGLLAAYAELLGRASLPVKDELLRAAG
jgi:alpha-1,6-mannosyltransferase